MKGQEGFNLVELLLVIALFGISIFVATVPLTQLIYNTTLADTHLVVKDSIRRIETQTLSGYLGTSWGVHLSGAPGCNFPATEFYIFRTSTFDSASSTTDLIELPGGGSIESVSVGGGCEIVFDRPNGTTSNPGTITVSGPNGATSTISVNSHGRVID